MYIHPRSLNQQTTKLFCSLVHAASRAARLAENNAAAENNDAVLQEGDDLDDLGAKLRREAEAASATPRKGDNFDTVHPGTL